MSHAPIQTIYHFTDGELQVLHTLCAFIHAAKEQTFDLGARRSDGTHYSVKERFGGLAAEYAVGRLLGACPCLSVERAGDGGVDLHLPKSDLTLDVKFRRRRDYDFATRTTDPQEVKADWLVLVWPGQEKRSLEIVGVLPRQEFLRLARVRNYGHGDRLVVQGKDFWPVAMIWERL